MRLPSADSGWSGSGGARLPSIGSTRSRLGRQPAERCHFRLSPAESAAR
ncbi:hypothetical protein [Streptomyces sp. NPDC002779]